MRRIDKALVRSDFMERNKKSTVLIPKYDVEKQMEFISSVCSDVEFDARVLITLILAGWICSFQESCLKSGPYASFKAYLDSAEPTYKRLLKIKEYAENGKDGNISCENS